MFGKYSTANSSTNKLTSLSLQSVPPELRFSLPYLKKLHQILTDNEVVNEHNESLVIEILYTIAEMVVYGDNKSEMLFDFFCEKNMLSLFLRIMWAPQQIDTGHICPIKVHIQILQTLSILINSVKNNTSLYYILSNNYINEILIFPHNFDEDESLRDQFVSFMKTLSLRLNPQTIQFFFVEETGSFPLLSKSIDMLHYSEPMVRIASQTTILNIFKVCDNRARVYALQDEFLYKFLSEIVKIMETFYYTIIQHILDYIIISKELNSLITNNKTDIIIKLNKIELLINDQISSTEDWFYFIQDLLDLKINKLRRITIYYILSEFIYSLLLSSIFSYSQSNIDTSIYSMTIIRNSNDSGKSSNNEEIKDSIDVQKNNLINMNSSFNANDDVNTSGDDSNNINNLNEIEIKESNDKLLVFALVSLHTIAQMFRIIIDPMFQRALTVAIFHPLSSTGRRKALMKLIPSSPSSIHGSNDSIPSDEDNSYQLNNFRQIFHHMYNQDNNRLTYFCVLIYLYVNTIRLSISIESIESIDSNVNLSKYINEWCYNISDDNYLDMKITPMKSIPESISPMPIQGFNTAMLLSPEYATSSSSFDSQNVFVPMKISQDFDDDIKVDNKIESNDEIKPNRNLDYNINNKTEANVNILKDEHYVYEIINELINNVVSNYTNTSDDSINNDESTNILNIIDKENIVSLPDDTIEKSNENVINKPKQYSLKYFAEPDDLEKDFDSMDSSSINQQIDIISIEKLKYIYDSFSLNNNNENICNDYLCQEFFGVLSRSPFNYSIITYQVNFDIKLMTYFFYFLVIYLLIF